MTLSDDAERARKEKFAQFKKSAPKVKRYHTSFRYGKMSENT